VELPHLAKLADEFRKDGIDLAAVSTMRHAMFAGDSARVDSAVVDEIAKLKGLAKLHNVQMPIGYVIPTGDFTRDYKVGNTSIIVIGRDGKILSIAPLYMTNLRTVFESLAANKIALGASH
jgi:hypothetical protein